MEMTIVLPPGEEKKLDSAELANLILRAIKKTLVDLKDLPPPSELRWVSRPEGKGITSHEIVASSYRHAVVWARINQIWRSEESIALTNYLWDRGASKLTMTGPDPNKDSWAFETYHRLVREPLMVALEGTARERLVDYGQSEPWIVDEEKIDKAVNDIVAFYGEHTQLVTAFCPLIGLELTSGVNLDLAPDIKIQKWTLRDQCIFLSRHGHEYHWEDFKAPYIRGVIAEISFPIKTGKGLQRDDIFSMVQDRLNLLKWTLLLAMDCDQPVAEGTCLIKGGLDVRMGRFQRDENMGPGSDDMLGEPIVSQCRDLIRNFRACAAQGEKQRDDLNQALWHFGRACVAALPRDILLESSIGLDSLLVTGGGDSKYKFCLHGTAVLSGQAANGAGLFKTLSKIYSERSQAAHGHHAREAERLASISRKKLAEAIRKIIDLALGKEIDLTIGVARAVEKYVLGKATS